MDPDRNLPIGGIILAIIASLAIMLIADSFWLGFAVGMIWIGSLFLYSEKAPARAAEKDTSLIGRNRMHEMLEHSGMPVLMLDQERIIMANAAMKDVLGTHIVGQDARIALRHPQAVSLLQRKRGGEQTIKGLRGAKSIWQMRLHRIDKRHSLVELQNRTAEADISRAHTDFVANASHELRTPLASIIGYVETLQEEGSSLDKNSRRKFFDRALQEANRLQSLIEDLMSLSRVEAEKHDLPTDDIDLSALVARASAEAGRPEDRIRVKLKIAGAKIQIQGDERQLEQMVRNLVDNALKYGDQDEDVTVSLAVGDMGRALLSVSDKGPGIAAEHLPHLTRRFYRTDPGRSRAAGGTGLGLAIVKHIVERHRGRLDIASQAGLGTTVTIKLPLSKAADDIVS